MQLHENCHETKWRSATKWQSDYIKGIRRKEQVTFENLTIASYNIRSLTDKLKKVQLSKYLKFYDLDVCCVQPGN